MRKSTAKYENYPVRRTGFFVWAALIFVWGVPASAQEPVRMQVKDSCGVQTEPFEAATYPGGIVAFQAWAYERTAQRIVAVAVAEYRSSLALRGSVRNWDSGRLTPAQRRTAVKEWCDRNLPLEGAVTVSFTITEKGRVTEVQASGVSDALETILRQAFVRSAPWIAARRSVDGQWRTEPSRFVFPVCTEQLRERLNEITNDGTGTTIAR